MLNSPFSLSVSLSRAVARGRAPRLSLQKSMSPIFARIHDITASASASLLVAWGAVGSWGSTHPLPLPHILAYLRGPHKSCAQDQERESTRADTTRGTYTYAAERFRHGGPSLPVRVFALACPHGLVFWAPPESPQVERRGRHHRLQAIFLRVGKLPLITPSRKHRRRKELELEPVPG